MLDSVLSPAVARNSDNFYKKNDIRVNALTHRVSKEQGDARGVSKSCNFIIIDLQVFVLP